MSAPFASPALGQVTDGGGAPPPHALERAASGERKSDRTSRRGGIAWAVIVFALIAVGLVGAALSSAGQWAEKDALDPEGAGPRGTLALVSILRDQGIDVTIARDRPSAERALTSRPSTLVMPDAAMLSDEALEDIADAARDVVLIDPRSRTARLFFPGAQPAGVGGTTVSASCELREAESAGEIAPGTLFSAGDADLACYRDGEGFALLIGDRSAGGAEPSRIALIDGTDLFTNEHLAENGNAALGVSLMGRQPALVWYVPALTDSDLASANPTLGEQTPPWVTPAILMLVVAALAAAVWRGRRFGPLVAEDLPVTVRASETMEGRGRLYARSRDALHAADALRIGALTRLARILGLGAAASAPDISDAAAARIGAPRATVHDILIDSLPRTDAELVALSDRLRDLEAAVHAAARTERNAP